MPQKTQAITIIIPTTAAPERHAHLRRALESVLTQEDVEVSVLLVANGCRCDEDFLNELRGTPGLTILRRTEGSLPLALKVGRGEIKTPFFGELDDDDVFLPGALRRLLDGLKDHPQADWIVGNVIVRCPLGEERLALHDLDTIRADPLRALMAENWLYPGSALFRTDRVTYDIFANIPKYLEWTYLALALGVNQPPAFLAKPVTVHHIGLSHSIDLSREATFGRIAAIKHLIAMPLPRPITRLLKGKLASLHHSCSIQHLLDGERRQAWACHLKSLSYPGGWIYFSFTRHLLRGALPATAPSS